MSRARSGAVVLAAGASVRLGRPKALVVCGERGETLVRRACRVALGAAAHVIVVSRPGLDLGVADLSVTVVENPDAATGMASSIRVGIATLAERDVEVALVLAVDQPLVETTDLQALLAALASETPMVAAAYEDTVGIPAAFRREVFASLLELTGDHGARYLLRRDGHGVARVAMAHAAVDIDTPADVRALGGGLARRDS